MLSWQHSQLLSSHFFQTTFPDGTIGAYRHSCPLYRIKKGVWRLDSKSFMWNKNILWVEHVLHEAHRNRRTNLVAVVPTVKTCTLDMHESNQKREISKFAHPEPSNGTNASLHTLTDRTSKMELIKFLGCQYIDQCEYDWTGKWSSMNTLMIKVKGSENVIRILKPRSQNLFPA